MIKKLRYPSNLKTTSCRRGSRFLGNLLIIILHLGLISGLQAADTSNSDDATNLVANLSLTTNIPKLIRSYNITDASTEDKSCFPTKGQGVIFQRADDCQGLHHIWRVNDKLTMNEYDNGTAAIVGSVIDDNGEIGHVNITLYDKENQGSTWNAGCYVNGISDPRSLYQSFNGTIKVGSTSYSIEKKVSEKHFILAEGAGFEPGQFGFGAWTSGSFGGCTEWFGNLDPIDIDCELQVDLGEDIEICGQEVVLSAALSGEGACTDVCEYVVSPPMRCNGPNSYVFTMGGQFTSDNVRFYELSNGTARYTADATNGVDNITIDITYSDKTYTSPSDSPKLNECEATDTTGWRYYQTTIGTVVSENHGVFSLTRKGPSFQIGNSAIHIAPGYGASGWLSITGGDGFYTGGDVNIALTEECVAAPNSGPSYLWSNGATTPSITVSEEGDYSVIVTDCTGCIATDTVSVQVNNIEVNAGDDVTISSGESTNLTATGGETYIWSSGDTTPSITVSPNETTTYSVMVTSANGECTDADEVVVIVDCILDVYLGDDLKICNESETILTANVTNIPTLPQIIASYNITDADTSTGICASKHGDEQGVILQKGNPNFPVTGKYNAWKVNGELILNEYDNGTAKITGSVIDELGNIGDVAMMLFDNQNQGKSWSAQCYEEGLSGPRNFYQSFHGTITVDGVAYTVEPKKTGHHFILADGASLESNQFGFGAWTAGSFGNGGEWFGNLEPIAIENCTEVSYLWSTGETTPTITVTASGTYSVTVKSCNDCEATDEVVVSVDDTVTIGNFVWLDDNRNGLQDEGSIGVNDVTVTLYQCNGDEVASTITAANALGFPGAYSFEVCPNSGEYYVVFSNIPDGTEFTDANAGNDTAINSTANENGRTACFEVTDTDNLTIDAGVTEICNIKIDAGDDTSICEGETIEITASLIENTADCPSVCVYPIKDQERCSGEPGNYEVFLMSTTGSVSDATFKASEQKLERYADNTARYTATATNGLDVIQIDALYTGYTSSAPINSPKLNKCQEYDTTDWEYWTTWSGTITSENHGVFNLSVKGAAFQMGDGADQMRTGFGASGWFYSEGGDGFYTTGDVNVTIDPCVENTVMYQWSTEDGNIVGTSNEKTISVDQVGTYTVEAINCIDCLTSDTIVVTKGKCSFLAKTLQSPKMSAVYPIPAKSGDVITVEFNVPSTSNSNLKSVPLKATVDYIERKEDVSVMMYDMTGRIIVAPKVFKVIDGKAVIYLELDYIPTGKYILRAQGPTWSDAKNILVE